MRGILSSSLTQLSGIPSRILAPTEVHNPPSKSPKLSAKLWEQLPAPARAGNQDLGVSSAVHPSMTSLFLEVTASWTPWLSHFPAQEGEMTVPSVQAAFGFGGRHAPLQTTRRFQHPSGPDWVKNCGSLAPPAVVSCLIGPLTSGRIINHCCQVQAPQVSCTPANVVPLSPVWSLSFSLTLPPPLVFLLLCLLCSTSPTNITKKHHNKNKMLQDDPNFFIIIIHNQGSECKIKGFWRCHWFSHSKLWS